MASLHKPTNKSDTTDTPGPECSDSAFERKQHWTLSDIPWYEIDQEQARGNLTSYYVVTAASFVETAADLYTANLVEHFSDPRAKHWLSNFWQPEELQHGRALRTYVEKVWPELDWVSHYQNFFAEYSKLCTMEELEPSPALEMVARCVVEAGTSTFYTTLLEFSEDPVLKILAGHIRQDEVSHYTHFRRFFEQYRQHEHVGRIEIMRSLYKRLTEVENEDAYIGLKHAWMMRNSNSEFDQENFQHVINELQHIMKSHYPYKMVLKMLIKPLDLNRTVVKLVLPLLEQAARHFLFKSVN
jgi:rubrerythrin